LLFLLLLPETYAPVLSKRSAKKENGRQMENPLRRSSSPNEPAMKSWKVILVRPFRLLLLEPIVLCICTYLAFAFGLQFLFFEAYPIIFHGELTSCAALIDSH
jgi:hypothetical protein